MVLDRISRKGLIVAATTFGSRIISSTFNFYYVKIVLDRYHMTQAWFQLSQSIFAVWNAVNDPWFGYLQDNSVDGWMSVRRKCILYGALPWVLSFLIPFFPWADYSTGGHELLCFFQGLIALCMFDTFFTFCLLAHCALMTEYAESDQERLTLVKYMGIAGIIGSSSVFFSNYFSVGLSNYGAFQFICFIQAIIALGLFSITGMFAETKYDIQPQKDKPAGSYWTLTKEIFKNKNFLLFVIMNFMQELHITYIMNFAKIFSEQMIPETELSNSGRSFLLGALMILPQVAVVALTPVVSRMGVYYLIMWSFYLKIATGILMYLSGAAETVWFLVFLVFDFTLSDGAFTFFTISLSDIADEDMARNSRQKPIASMIYGSNALVVKPALSLSPMAVAGLMNLYGYESVKAGTASSSDKQQLQHLIFTFSCFAPVVIGLIQIFVWRRYTLRGGSK